MTRWNAMITITDFVREEEPEESGNNIANEIERKALELAKLVAHEGNIDVIKEDLFNFVAEFREIDSAADLADTVHSFKSYCDTYGIFVG